MDGCAGFGGDMTGMVVMFLWCGRWWCFGVDSRALLQSVEPVGRAGSMGLPEYKNAGFVILVLDYQCDFGCWFMVLVICDSAINRTVVLICVVGANIR